MVLPVQASHGSPHCWCYHENQKCEHHSWADDKSIPFTCDNNQQTGCNAFCTKKGAGWSAKHCDTPDAQHGDKGYINQNAVDNDCAKASQGETGKADKVKPTPDSIELGVAIQGRTVVTGLADYIAASYRYAIGIVAIAAIVMIVYGGFRYLIGSAMSDVSKGKKIIFDALMGLLIVLGAYLILQTINQDTLSLKVAGLTDIQGNGYQSVKGKDRACKLDEECQDAGSGSGACIWYKVNEGQCADGTKGSICGFAGARERGSSWSKLDANNNNQNWFPCADNKLACMWPPDVYEGNNPFPDDNDYWFRCVDPSKILGKEGKPVTSPNGVGSPCKSDSVCRERLKDPYAACIMLSEDTGECVNGSEGSRCKCNAASGGCGVRDSDKNNGNAGLIACSINFKCVLAHTVPNNERGFIDGDWTCQKY